LEKEQEKLLGAKVAVDRMKYKNRMREMGVLQSAIPLSLFQKVLSLPLIIKQVGRTGKEIGKETRRIPCK
jgi:hypothetical protein